MKHLMITLIFHLSFYFVYSQQFEFELVFNDAVGNTDTLDFGYDITATNGIDAVFGETNIISNPITSAFDIRFSDVIKNGTLNPTHQSKKQIITDECPNWLLSDFGTSIEIYSNNYPVTVKWNSTIFNDTCRIGTILTDVHPGGWFDTQGSFRTFLEQTDSVIINPPYYYYTNGQSQSIGVMWISFMDTSVFNIPFSPIIFDPNWTSIEESNSSMLLVYPNPISDNLTISYPEKIKALELFNIRGQLVYTQSNYGFENIDLSFLESGIYFLKVETEKGLFMLKKLIKK